MLVVKFWIFCNSLKIESFLKIKANATTEQRLDTIDEKKFEMMKNEFPFLKKKALQDIYKIKRKGGKRDRSGATEDTTSNQVIFPVCIITI
jgi:hypothetical protein